MKGDWGRWAKFWGAPKFSPSEPLIVPRVRTEHPITVFSGGASEWVRYLDLPRTERHEGTYRLRIEWDATAAHLNFVALRPEGRPLADLLNDSFSQARQLLTSKPHVARAFERLIFANRSNSDPDLGLCTSALLPAEATREALLGQDLSTRQTTLVLRDDLVRAVLERAHASEAGDTAAPRTLALAWPLFSRTLAQLAYPARPRDRFVEKVKTFAKQTYVVVNLLYETRREGRLVPGPVGRAFEQYVAERDGIPASELSLRHPYFKLLHDVGYVLKGEPYRRYSDDLKVAVREYLDRQYLRMSLAGVMPPVTAAMLPRPFEHGKRIRAPEPEIGKYGVLDKDDLKAWHRIDKSMRRLGLLPLRQLGMGEFGRVYEALNQASPDFPERVAVKVDRITGSTKRAILGVRETMELSRELSRALHVIRVYDAGKLVDTDYTYHVLQFVDGDTLDNLLEIAGSEHRSLRPGAFGGTPAELQHQFEQGIGSAPVSATEAAPLVRAPFLDALSPTMVLDLLTSLLLWIEEVHASGYAINDLKNGNVMMSRQGQLKGIDLDAYARARSPSERMSDFMFLAVSLVLLLSTAPLKHRKKRAAWRELIESRKKLRQGLSEAWPARSFAFVARGRVDAEEVLDLFEDLVARSRDRTYAENAELFSSDIARLVALKYRLFNDEIVLD